MREDAWRKKVVNLAHKQGWRVAFFHRLPTQGQAWRTPVGADGAGWPDLVLCRERVIFVELKADPGRLTPEQRIWVDALTNAGAEVHVWKPKDIETVEETLLDRRSDIQLRLEKASGGDTEHAQRVMDMIKGGGA